VAGPIMTAMLAWTVCLALPGNPESAPANPENSLAVLAGDYGYGDGFSSHSLRITSEGRFLSESRGCLGVYDCNSGRAEVVDGHLVLTSDVLNPRRIVVYAGMMKEMVLGTLSQAVLLAMENAEDRPDLPDYLLELGGQFHELAEQFVETSKPNDFVLIRWGERLQLVPSDDGPAYCNLVNLGWAARHPDRYFYLRVSEKEQKVDGLPSVPDEWKAMLLETPIHGKVINVMADGRARVDLGAEHGVWKGMYLVTNSERWEVVEVGATSSIIKKQDRRQPPFTKGQGVCSMDLK
jgi:hypothetical protein